MTDPHPPQPPPDPWAPPAAGPRPSFGPPTGSPVIYAPPPDGQGYPPAYDPTQPPPAYSYGYTPPPPPAATGWPTDTGWMEFDPAQPQPRWGMPDVLLGIVVFIVGSLLFALPVALLTGNAALVGITGLLGSWVTTVGYLVVLSKVKGQGSLRRDFGFSFSWWDPLIGMGAGFTTMIVSGIVAALIAAAFSEEKPRSNAEAIFGEVINNKPLLVVMALMAAIGAPLVEELLFRGLALRAVERRFGGIAGVLISSLLFAVLHLQGGGVAVAVGLVAVIAIYGFVFSALTRGFRRLGPAIFTHIFINGLQSAVLVYLAFSGADLPF